MSIYDLATDVGLSKGSDEYNTFTSCVHNILELGTGYSKKAMQDIIEKCEKSDLDIAKKVISECTRAPSTLRKSRLKWWQTYVPRRERISRDIYIDRTGDRRNVDRASSKSRKKKRSMSPMFEREPQAKDKRPDRRPMSPLFQAESKRYRAPSPSWSSRRSEAQSPIYERSHSSSDTSERSSMVPQWGEKREMSPMFEPRRKRDNDYPPRSAPRSESRRPNKRYRDRSPEHVERYRDEPNYRRRHQGKHRKRRRY